MQPGNIDHRLNLEWFLGGNPENASAAFDSASGALLVNADAPPTLILQGELDVKGLGEVIQLMAEAGELKPPLPSPERFVDLQYLKAAGLQ